MTSLDKIIAYKNIIPYLKTEEREELSKKLGLSESDKTTRIGGLENETELFLILFYLKSCKNIVAIDEAPSVLTGTYSPDALIELKNGEKFFLEIKSVNDIKYKISGGNLEKRIDFAKSFGFPLYFAVKFKFFWGLYTSDLIKAKKGKLHLAEDFMISEFEKKFNSNMYLFPAGFKIESTYEHDSKNGVGIVNPDYGNLIDYKFYFANKLIFNFNKDDKKNLIISMVLEGLHNATAEQSQKVEKIDDKITKITECLLKNVFIYDYVFYLVSIQHTISDSGEIYDRTSFFKNLLETKKEIITKELLLNVIEYLKEKKVPIIEVSKDKKT